MMTRKGQLDKITRSLNPLGPIRVRTQFGGFSLSVNKVTFAVVSRGELYLRACEASQTYLCERKLPALQLTKRGLPVQLNYYRVDERLWAEPEQLLALSRLCLEGAKHERQEASEAKLVRDLPNISHQLERLLREVGINSIQGLRREGAKNSWLKLRLYNQHVGVNTLYALQGALTGFHYQALPAETRDELRQWYEFTLRRLRQQKPGQQ